MKDYNKPQKLKQMKKLMEDCISSRIDISLDTFAKKFAEKAYEIAVPEGSVVLTQDQVDSLLYGNFGVMLSPIGELPINSIGLRKAVDEIVRLNTNQRELDLLNSKYYNEAKQAQETISLLRNSTFSQEEVNYKIEESQKQMARDFLNEYGYLLSDRAKDEIISKYKLGEDKK